MGRSAKRGDLSVASRRCNWLRTSQDTAQHMSAADSLRAHTAADGGQDGTSGAGRQSRHTQVSQQCLPTRLTESAGVTEGMVGSELAGRGPAERCSAEPSRAMPLRVDVPAWHQGCSAVAVIGPRIPIFYFGTAVWLVAPTCAHVPVTVELQSPGTARVRSPSGRDI